MTELIIQIPPQKESLLKELIEELGGSVIEKKASARSKSKTPTKEKGETEKIDHTYLFGKWKDFDIDARKLREELWKRD